MCLCVPNARNSNIAFSGGIEPAVRNMLSSFDENLRVYPYWKRCDCRYQSELESRDDRYLAELGCTKEQFIERIRLEHEAWCSANGVRPFSILSKNEHAESDWTARLSPINAINDRVSEEYEQNDPTIGANPECAMCGGSGMTTSTFNRQAKWDWYIIGGRYTGRICPNGYSPLDDPRNVVSCTNCKGTGRHVIDHKLIMSWLQSEGLAFKSIELPLDLESRRSLANSCKESLECGSMSPCEALRVLYPTLAHGVSDDGLEFECWVCKGSRSRVASPSIYAKYSGDVQRARTLKNLLNTDLARYTPHAVCVENDHGVSSWHEAGVMRVAGIMHRHQSADGWRSDFADLAATLDDDLAVIVVDCHI